MLTVRLSSSCHDLFLDRLKTIDVCVGVSVGKPSEVSDVWKVRAVCVCVSVGITNWLSSGCLSMFITVAGMLVSSDVTDWL